jgi:hypothetical protein
MNSIDAAIIALSASGLIFCAVAGWVLLKIIPPVNPKRKSDIKPAE